MNWKLLFKAIALGVLAFLGLRSVFSLEQAFLLALGFAVVAMAIMERDAKQAEPARFWVRIEPNWRPLLTDYGLVTDESGWSKIQKHHSDHPDRWTVVRNGIGFTVLRRDLFYSNDHHYFFSEVELEVDIEGLSSAKAEFLLGDFVPRFYIKDRRDWKEHRRYLEFGLITVESINQSMSNEDSRWIPVARLPYEFFSGEYGGELSRHKLAALDRKLTDAGWKRKKRDYDDGFLRTPFEIEHRYVTMSYNGI